MGYIQKKKIKKKKSINRAGALCAGCAVLILVVVFSVQIIQAHHKTETYKARQEQLQAQIEEQKQRAEELENEKEYVGSEEYIENEAKTKLGMAYDNEIIFKEEN